MLNCCSGEIVLKTNIEDGILKVHFYENTPGICICICHYDLDCIIGSMVSRKYEVEVYTGGNNPDAQFSLTFSPGMNMKYDIPD